MPRCFIWVPFDINTKIQVCKPLCSLLWSSESIINSVHSWLPVKNCRLYLNYDILSPSGHFLNSKILSKFSNNPPTNINGSTLHLFGPLGQIDVLNLYCLKEILKCPSKEVQRRGFKEEILNRKSSFQFIVKLVLECLTISLIN